MRGCAALGVQFIHGDIRMRERFRTASRRGLGDRRRGESERAGRHETAFSSRQLFEHNLGSVVNILEYCKAHKAGLMLTEHQPRVFHPGAAHAAAQESTSDAFVLDDAGTSASLASPRCGIGVGFFDRAPISLYGSTKLACGSHGA